MASKKDNSFRTDALTIANLKNSLTESAEGDLVFKDIYFPAGVRLKDFTGAWYSSLYNQLLGVTGQFQNEVNDLQSQIDYLYVATDLAGTSAYLQYQIINNHSEMVAISGHFDQTISNNYSIMVDISGNLQNQIINNYLYLVAASGTLESQILALEVTSLLVSKALRGLFL